MFDLITPAQFIFAIITAVLGDLLLRGIWRFIDMTPPEKEQSTSSIKTTFMISFPISFISLAIVLAHPANMAFLLYPCAFIAGLSILISASMFFDALKHIRNLEQKVKKLTDEKTNEHADK